MMNKKELIEQIQMETKLIHNIQGYSYILLTLASIPAALLYIGKCKILALIFLALCISLALLSGLGAYRGKKRVNAMIDLLR